MWFIGYLRISYVIIEVSSLELHQPESMLEKVFPVFYQPSYRLMSSRVAMEISTYEQHVNIYSNSADFLHLYSRKSIKASVYSISDFIKSTERFSFTYQLETPMLLANITLNGG